MPAAELAVRINAILPQTQCMRCGFPDCASYARAVAFDGAAINRCPPGGAQGVQRLARLAGRPEAPLDAECGLEQPRGVAVIDEAWCIGCTLCLDACPTDAIMGLNKQLHTVASEHCTGCELCLAVCPVDCIQMENASGTATGWQAWSTEQADRARRRYDARTARLQRARPVAAAPAAAGDKQDIIAAMLERARAQRR